MGKSIITLCYRKIIDVNSVRAWEKMIFDDTYSEFCMQAQYYNQENRYQSFAQLIREVPGADKLHFLVSSAAYGYIQQLKERIPDIVNALGKQFLTFRKFKFEIINSDIRNKAAHQVAVNFFSEELIWFDTIGNSLLVAENETAGVETVLTNLFVLQPFLNIYSVKEGG